MYFDHENEGINIPPSNQIPQQENQTNAERFTSEEALLQKYEDHVSRKQQEEHNNSGILNKLKSAFSSITHYIFSCCFCYSK